jgi:anti-sigma factor RsiW
MLMVLPERLSTKLDHRWSRRRMSQYIDGELGSRERRRLDRHTDICPECRRALRTLSVVVSALRGLRRPEQAGVGPRVVQRLKRESTGESENGSGG